MSIAEIEAKILHVTLIPNCHASVPQTAPAPMNPGEVIPMWLVVGFPFYCGFQIRKFIYTTLKKSCVSKQSSQMTVSPGKHLNR